MGAVMEERPWIGNQIIGVFFLLFGLLIGVPLFVYGLALMIGDCFIPDATGLSVIVTLPMMGLGILFSCSLLLAIRFLRLRLQQLVPYVLLVAIVPMFFATRQTIAVKSEYDTEYQQQEERAKIRDQEILAKFEKSPQVAVMAVCDIPLNIQGNDLKDLQAWKRQFALEEIIQPVGSQHISNYAIHPWGDHEVYFIAEVTRDGYERLKHNQHIWKIAAFEGSEAQTACKLK
jgi:hypothetical protein